MSKSMRDRDSKAYQEWQADIEREAQRKKDIADDLVVLAAFRRWVMFQSKVRLPSDEITKAIDDYAGELTGNPKALHTQHHSIP